jgi:hypothetical protein
MVSLEDSQCSAYNLKRHGSSVSKLMDYGWKACARIPGRPHFFTTSVLTDHGVHLVSYQVGTREFSLGIKRPEREYHRLSIYDAQVNNVLSADAFLAW